VLNYNLDREKEGKKYHDQEYKNGLTLEHKKNCNALADQERKPHNHHNSYIEVIQQIQ
jgi:hypothetical protein